MTLLRALITLLCVIAVVSAYLWMSTDDFQQQQSAEAIRLGATSVKPLQD